jgi:hypothetical protein
LAGCSWYPSRLLKSTVHHRLYIQWVVSNQRFLQCLAILQERIKTPLNGS